MNLKRYEKLLNDRNVRKVFRSPFVEYFVNIKKEMVIEFMFGYMGIIADESSFPRIKRISVRTFPKSNFINDCPYVLLDQEIIILANADNNLYALSYLLQINANKNELSVVVMDTPFLGEKLITTEEKSGITIPLKLQV